MNHFRVPATYVAMMPPWLPWPSGLSAIAGIAEILGGIGIFLPQTRRVAGWGLIALLAAVFPANVHMARNPEKFEKIPAWALYARLPLQPLMMWWAWRATKPS